MQADHLELCYELFSATACYKAFWSTEVENSQNVWFCRNCDNVSNCFGCANLKNKQYHIFNQPYSKEEYKEKLDAMKLDTYSGLRKAQAEAYMFWKKFPVKYMRATMNLDADGEFIYDSKNVHKSYHIGEAENVKYSFNAFINVADCWDYCTWGNGAQMLYECLIAGEGVKNMKFCLECWPSSQDMEYSAHCRSSSDCFACVGLKKKQYCIFNKQYSKDEYLALRNKIVKHMNDMPYIVEKRDEKGEMRKIVYKYGEFFPTEFSPFAINETNTVDYFPFTKEAAEKQGFVWRPPQAHEFQITVKADELPDATEDVEEAITKELIGCAGCGRAYRIIPLESQFYKQVGMPIPRYCHECRHAARVKRFKPPMKWYPGRCMCDYKIYGNFSTHAHHTEGRCQNEFETTHAPESGDIVYCEPCYNAEAIA